MEYLAIAGYFVGSAVVATGACVIIESCLERNQQAHARNRQIRSERENRLHQQHLEEIDYQHRTKMENLNEINASMEGQIEEVREKLRKLKKNNPQQEHKTKPN